MNGKKLMKRKKRMFDLMQVNAERLKDFQREAANERLARSSQKQEKRNLLQNTLNTLKGFNSEAKER
jgi:hypothetical protein